MRTTIMAAIALGLVACGGPAITPPGEKPADTKQDSTQPGTKDPRDPATPRPGGSLTNGFRAGLQQDGSIAFERVAP